MQEVGIALMGKLMALRGDFDNEHGQGMVEYGLILAFVALAAIAGLTVLHTQIANLFLNITTAFANAGS